MASLKAPQEVKIPVTPKGGGNRPNSLVSPLGYTLVDTSESLSLSSTLRSLFTDKHYHFRLSTALNMSSSSGGAVNSTLSNSALVTNVDFISLSTVFNEFFIESFEAHWQPVSLYNYPLSGSIGTNVSSLPLGVADLQHGQAAYSNLSTMTDNFHFKFVNTGAPFTSVWRNTERMGDTTLASLTDPTQSWCTSNNATNYQGTLQFLSQSAPPGLPASQVLGVFAVYWNVYFRVRA